MIKLIDRFNFIALYFLLFPVLSLSHHSMAEFDRTVVSEIEGLVSKISWRNPHILFEIEEKREDSSTITWIVEGGAISAQRRRGFTGDEISIGDRVLVAGNPSTARDNYIQVSHMLIQDQQLELLLGASSEPRWSNTFIGDDRSLAIDVGYSENPGIDSSLSRENIFKVWSQAVRAWFFQDTSQNLTDSAIIAASNFDNILDNPLLECVPPGMPSLMGNPYPMQFFQAGGNIEIIFEEFDAKRIIVMGENILDAEDIPYSHTGYSIGEWQDSTLVVKTDGIDWPYLNRVGVPQSTNVKITEYFNATDDVLHYKLVVDEPISLLEPFVWEAHWINLPGETVEPYQCVAEDTA